MRRYRFVLAILVALLLPSLAFSYSITMRATVNPDSLDPQIMYNSALNFIERALFVSLVDFDEVNAVPIPDLAKSWDVSADGKTWTFHLRNDVKWTNGRAVTARDVEYSVKRLLDPATASGIAPKLYPVVGAKDYNTGVTKDASKVAVKALDDWNVQFQLTDPLAFFAAQVRLAGFPVPKEAIDKYGTGWYEQGKIVSNGPYTLKEFKPHDRLVLQKNPNYYDAKNVQIDTVTVLIITDDSTAMSMYEAGQLDTVDVPSGDVDRVLKDSVLSKQAKSVGQLVMYMIQINTKFPPFDKPDVRKAFAAAIDKESLVKNITKKGETPRDTLVPLGCFGAVPQGAGVGIHFDPAKAKEYLAKAGYPGGKGLPPIEFAFNPSEFNRMVAEALQQMWKKNLGLDIAVKGYEGEVFWNSIVAGKLPFWRMGYAAEVPDADTFMNDIPHTVNGEKNLRWERKDFDALVDKAKIEQNADTRKQLYLQAEKILTDEECAIIPLWSYAYVNLTKPTLTRQYSKMMIDSLKNWKSTK